MHYYDLLVPCPSDLKGVGDEPNTEVERASLRRDAGVRHKGKRDLHGSFPKGLPKAFELKEKD